MLFRSQQHPLLPEGGRRGHRLRPRQGRDDEDARQLLPRHPGQGAVPDGRGPRPDRGRHPHLGGGRRPVLLPVRGNYIGADMRDGTHPVMS